MKILTSPPNRGKSNIREVRGEFVNKAQLYLYFAAKAVVQGIQ